MRRLAKVGLGIGIAFAVLIAIGAASPREETTPVSTEEPVQETGEIRKTRTFTDSDFAVLYASPDKYSGSNVDITGKIFTAPEMQDNRIAFQMYQGGKFNLDRNAVVYLEGNDPSQFTEDDCVRVIGVSQGQIEGTNLFGGTVTAPAINANLVEKLDCKDVFYPAKKIVNVQSTQTQGGIMVTLNKVEFAEEHTRAYVTVQNMNAESKIYFLDSNAVAFQGSRQFETTYTFDVDFPEIKYEIYPGIKEEGVILFEPLDYTLDMAKFQFEARGESLLDENKFVFNVTIS